MKQRALLILIFIVCLLAALLSIMRMGFCILTNPVKAFQIAVSIDRSFNAAANGDGRETLSSRLNRDRLEHRRIACIVCALLDVLEKDHCAKSAGT